MTTSLAPARLPKPWTRLMGGRVVAWPDRGDLMRLRPATRVLLLGLCGWAMIAVVLSAAVVLWPSARPAPDATPLSAGSGAPGNPGADVAIARRPLFARTRRAAAEPVAIQAAPAPTRDRTVILKGVFINGSDARAFLTSGTEPTGRWVTPNDTIAGWTVAALAADEVRLTAADDSLTVWLHPAQGGGDAMPPRAGTPLFPRGPLPPNRSNPEAGAAIDEQKQMETHPSNGARAFGVFNVLRSNATP